MHHHKFGLIVFAMVCYIGVCLSANSTSVTENQSVPASEPTRKEYVVFSGNTTKQTQKLRNDLRSLLGTENVLEIGGPYTGPQFWLVHMNDQQVLTLIVSSPGVSKDPYSNFWLRLCIAFSAWHNHID